MHEDGHEEGEGKECDNKTFRSGSIPLVPTIPSCTVRPVKTPETGSGYKWDGDEVEMDVSRLQRRMPRPVKGDHPE